MTVAAREFSATGFSLVADIVPFWARRTPDSFALVEAGRNWTYGELDIAVSRTAAWLAEIGLRSGDRLMLICENCCAAVAIYLACNALGAWPVIVNAKLSDREIDEIREHSDARLAVLTVGSSLRASAHAGRLKAMPADPGGYEPVSFVIFNEAAVPEPAFGEPEGHVAALIYTTGTTGRPKGVMLGDENLLFVARATARARRLTPNDRVLAILPISHILGLTGVLLGTLIAGGTVCLASRFDPASVLSALKNDGLSVMIGTPSLYALLAEYAQRNGLVPIAGPALRLISSAGAPLDAATKAVAEKAFSRVLHNGYGITECGPTISLTSLESPRSDCSVGKVLPGIETRLVCADGKDAVPGEAGELWVRSPGVMKGYYKAPAETVEAVMAGWFRTGDLAHIEGDNLFIVGRSKEIIIRFGFNVHPAEVESVFNAYPGVMRSAVIGRQVEGSEEIFAFVQPLSGANITPEQLSDFAASQLVSYKRPSRILVVAALPMSPAGKVLKSELSALLQ